MTKFLFGIHLHQPVDNLPEAVEEAIERCYRPLVKLLEEFEEVRFSFHCSGWLLSRLEKERDIFKALKRMHKRGQMEIFGGGYYEPILPAIPSKDRRVQIAKLSKYCKRRFKRRPRGAWLAERVWSDTLIADLAASKIAYAMVDDYHFLASGYEEVEGYYVTEDGEHSVALFSISKELRYAVPFLPVDEAIEAIEARDVAILFDDAEKFGLWPGTFDWVYEKGWLRKFLEKLSQSDRIETLRFCDFYKRSEPLGTAYLCNLSYAEMCEWALDAKDGIRFERIKRHCENEDIEKFCKGTTWKHFLSKYPESNHLHKRMLQMSRQGVSQALLKLQTNDVYWHGIFGGLYLPNLRDNAYRALARCEKRSHYKPRSLEDYDLDGNKELFLRNDRFVCLFDIANGAKMVEFLDKKEEINYQNTLTRYFEAYHHKILHPHFSTKHSKGITTIHEMEHSIDEALLERLIFDRTTRASFVDHICTKDFDAQKFHKSDFVSLCDLQSAYEYRDGAFYKSAPIGLEEESIPFGLVKRIELAKRGLNFFIGWQTQRPLDLRYVLECNFKLRSPNLFVQGQKLQEPITYEGKRFLISDGNHTLKIRFDKKAQAHFFLIETLSQNERGFEYTVQGIAMAFCFDLSVGSIQGKIRVRHG